MAARMKYFASRVLPKVEYSCGFGRIRGGRPTLKLGK